MSGRKSAFDFERCAAFYADAPSGSNAAPSRRREAWNRMAGKKSIADFLGRVCGADFGITIADEVICVERAASSVDRAFPTRRRGMGEGTRVKEEKPW